MCRGYAAQPNYPMKFSIILLGIVCLAGPVFAAEAPPPPARHFKVIQTAKANYPVRMIEEGVRHGTARVALHVNAKGELVDFLVVVYTRSAFAEEVERVIKKWKFEPEYVDGEPIETIMEVTFNFEVDGIMLVQKFGNFTPPSFVEFGGEYEYQACSLKKLDGIPVPVTVVPPTYPREWAEKGIIGKVVVDFYIDETGKTRFVAAPSGGHPMLSGIAVAAVNRWQFAPPTRKNKPVLVHAQQIFDFRKEDESGK